MKYNAIEKSTFIENELKAYIKSTFQIQDKEFLDLFHNEINDVELMKGPYVSISHPFVMGSSISDLIDEKILTDEMYKMKKLNLARPLYHHQEQAVRKAGEGRNLVVSTGTGSGKTESFLIPILNEITKDILEGKVNRGIQALLLYPMNALANDQRERVREILADYPDITFGFFTGETKHTERKARQEYEGENDRLPLKNEYISREVIRETPPNILFTNYSMLEFLLIRPTDKNLFTTENTKNWKYIVMDEAHVYRGALGIEISLLIKRLLGNISSNPNFILTSATLASTEDDFPEVIDFAERLTSQKFTEDSIIVANRRIVANKEQLINLSEQDYIRILNDDDYVHDLYYEYFDEEVSDLDVAIHNLIKSDRNYHNFIDILKTPKTVNQITKLMNAFSEEGIISLITLVSRLNKRFDLTLIDIKFHTFIKTVDAALVTIKPEKSLSLKNTAEHRHFDEHGNLVRSKVFTLGVCKHCNEPYLVGKISGNKYYNQDDEDLYDQFEDRYLKSLDILLLNTDSLSLEENQDNIRTMILCNKCGTIYDKENLNASKCNCGSEYSIETVMYKDNKRNNITKCMSCDSRSNSGIIKSFYIGKDSATSIIAQFLYKKLGYKEEQEVYEEVEEDFDFFNVNITNDHIENKRIDEKQIITFSDSRQQASFFATYFESMHLSFLRSRLIISAMDDAERKNVNDLIREINYIIDKKQLFPNSENSMKEAWITILIELLNVKSTYSLKGLGLIGIQAQHDFGMMNESHVKKEFPEFSFEDFKKIIFYILDSMRTIPAINYFDAASLSFEERRSALSYRGIDNGGITVDVNDTKYAKSLIPKSNRGNHYTDYLMRAFGIDFERSKDYLRKIGNYLLNLKSNKYLSRNDVGAYVYDYKGFEFINPKFIDWYVCNKCKTITDININDTCMKRGCTGKLGVVDPSDLNENNYYYKEYTTKELERIRVEEHTAQLEHKKAREYQKAFSEGDINILSSSTTFEMGVDIGDLDSVYMRNVPPTPANYIQRAGRAGRRNETSAYVLTFCSTNSHDYTYFESPIKMIEGKITPPYFEVKNIKIIDRHILSTMLSFFFRKFPEYFESAENLIGDDGLENFKGYIETNKEKLIEYIQKYIDVNFNNRYEQWFLDIFESPESPLIIMQRDYLDSIETLTLALTNSDLKEWEYGQTQSSIRGIKEEKVINVLSKFNVIPKYGFPIDSVELKIPGHEKNYNPDRDLSTAISEYAPESEVIVDKKKFKSRYIVTGKNREPVTYYYKVCDSCQTLIISMAKYDNKLQGCNNCNENLEENEVNVFIKPIYGFISDNEEMTDKSIKPKRTYSSDYFYIGNSEEVDYEELIENVVSIKSLKDNHLALLNQSDFFTCALCGYTVINSADRGFPSIRKDHKKSDGLFECSNDVLTATSLGHEFRTDIILLEFFEENIEVTDSISVMYALLEGISNALEIERSDISGIVQNIKGKSRIILFDNVPGGAGHVKRLLNKEDFTKVIRSAYMKVSQECCDESTSCYNCLRNYQNRSSHNFIVRGLAKNFLEKFVEILD